MMKDFLYVGTIQQKSNRRDGGSRCRNVVPLELVKSEASAYSGQEPKFFALQPLGTRPMKD